MRGWVLNGSDGVSGGVSEGFPGVSGGFLQMKPCESVDQTMGKRVFCVPIKGFPLVELRPFIILKGRNGPASGWGRYLF